jgi:hypothetical protein
MATDVRAAMSGAAEPLASPLPMSAYARSQFTAAIVIGALLRTTP